MLRAIAATLIIATAVIYLVHLHQQQWQLQICVASRTGGDPSCLSDSDTLAQADVALAYAVAHNDAGDGFPNNLLQMKINVVDANGTILAQAGHALLPLPGLPTESRHAWPLTQVFETGGLRMLSGQFYRLELDSVSSTSSSTMGTATFQMQ
jgi:hypothetical protein